MKGLGHNFISIRCLKAIDRPKEVFKLRHDFDRNTVYTFSFSENAQQNMLWSTFDTKVKQADEKVQVYNKL